MHREERQKFRLVMGIKREFYERSSGMCATTGGIVWGRIWTIDEMCSLHSAKWCVEDELKISFDFCSSKQRQFRRHCSICNKKENDIYWHRSEYGSFNKFLNFWHHIVGNFQMFQIIMNDFILRSDENVNNIFACSQCSRVAIIRVLVLVKFTKNFIRSFAA